MQCTERQARIISYILSQKEYVTSEVLAKKIGVSSRTIKNDMKSILQIQDLIGIKIISSVKQGYKIECFDNDKLDLFLNTDNILDFNSRQNRLRFIILQMLTNDHCSKMRLMTDMNVSDSTLNKDIAVVKQMLLDDNVRISFNQKNGIDVFGSETDIRKAIAKYIDIDYSSIYQYNALFFDNKIKDEDIKYLTDRFIEILHKHRIEIIGVQITSIIIHMIIMIYRIRHGFNIVQFFKPSVKPASEAESETVDGLANVISDYYQIQLSDEERMYLQYILMGKGFRSQEIDADVQKTMLETFETIQDFYGICFKVDDDASVALYVHTVTMIDRLQHGITIDKSIVAYVRDQFVLAYEMAIIYQKNLKKVCNLNITDEEVCYLAVHFGALIEKYKQKDSIPKVVLITEVNNGHVLLLKNSLNSFFGNHINIIKLLSPYELSCLEALDYDYVFTTEKLPEHLHSKCLLIPPLLDKRALQTIDRYMKTQISIHELFSEQTFSILTEKKDAKACITEMLTHSKQLNLISDVNRFLIMTMEREELQSTKFNDLLALPHPIRPEANKNFIYVVINRQQIKWFDDSIAKLVLFIGIKADEKDNVRSIFDVIAKISSSKELIENLINVNSFTEFIKLIETD